MSAIPSANKPLFRDYLGGEKAIQGFSISLSQHQPLLSHLVRKGDGWRICGLLSGALPGRYRDMKFGYLVELKYIARNAFSHSELAAKISEAETQLACYASDPRIQQVAEQVTRNRFWSTMAGELVYRAEVRL